MRGISMAFAGLAVLLSASRAEDRPGPFTADLSKIVDGKTWTMVNVEATSADEDGRRVARLAPKESDPNAPSQVGIAYLKDFDFADGTIEVDLKGRDVFRQSFLGVAFHGVDVKEFEGVYFRPFNFKAPAERRGRAVQYIAWPTYTWEKLRKERPGVFEHPVTPVPDPNQWFHARIEVKGKVVKVFVDGAEEPSLVVDRLADRPRGKVGLWADTYGASYSTLKITRFP